MKEVFSIKDSSKTLAEYINQLRKLGEFKVVIEIDGSYQNMGAIIIDAVLQAGISYKNTVKPRVKSYLDNHPNTITTSQFKSLIDQVKLTELINWNASAKTERIENLTDFLIQNKIETQDEFKVWLDKEENIKELKKISGIKNKTADYLKILTGHSTIAPDRHLLDFLSRAGITVNNYKEAQSVISGAALILSIDEAFLDHSIWKFMSELKRQQPSTKSSSCKP